MQLHISAIHVDQLGGLSVSGLSPGLNVIYGSNGSGKSTLLRFVRTLLAALRGDADLNDGDCDGFVELTAEAPLTLIAQRRSYGAATVAIRCFGSEVQPIDDFRRFVTNFDLSLLDAVCLVDPLAAGHARDIQSVIESLANADDALSPSRLEAAKQSLLRLEQECEHLGLELATARRTLARAEREARAEQRRIANDIAAVEAEMERLDLDHQAAVTDLREAEDRLWNGNDSTAVRQSPEIGRDEQSFGYLLKLLADRRHAVSLQLANAPGHAAAELFHERQLIDDCERELLNRRPTIGRDPVVSRRPADSVPVLHDRIRRLKSQHDARLPELRELRCEFREVLQRHDAQLASRRQILVELSNTLTAARRRLAELREKPTRVEPRLPGVLAAAGDHVRHLTLNRYDGLEWQADEAEVCLRNGDAAAAVATLSRGTLEQAAMAVRLAAANAVLPGMPLIWDEVLADCDEARVAAACIALANAAAERQIIMFTCRTQIAELLVQHGATIHTLGGAALPSFAEGNAVSVEPASRDRFWLEPDSPLSQIPSLGRQLLRELTRHGLRNVGDLLIADATAIAAERPEAFSTLEQLTVAQAEVRLLLSVPNLTARDAQLLVACGIATADQLAYSDVDDLVARIDQQRTATQIDAEVPESWPLRSDIETWIRMGRAGRSTVLRSGGKQAAPATEISGGRNQPGDAFRLHREAPVADAPAIGLATARRLAQFGVQTVADLMSADPAQLAQRLRHTRLSAEAIRRCQQQCGLMCALPDVTAAAARALVECGIHSPRDLQRISASTLHGLLREQIKDVEISAAQVTSWIEFAQDLGARAA